MGDICFWIIMLYWANHKIVSLDLLFLWSAFCFAQMISVTLQVSLRCHFSSLELVLRLELQLWCRFVIWSFHKISYICAELFSFVKFAINMNFLWYHSMMQASTTSLVSLSRVLFPSLIWRNLMFAVLYM